MNAAEKLWIAADQHDEIADELRAQADEAIDEGWEHAVLSHRCMEHRFYADQLARQAYAAE